MQKRPPVITAMAPNWETPPVASVFSTAGGL